MIVETRIVLTGLPLAIAIRGVLEALADAWAVELKNRPLPLLYLSGVRYQEEPNAGSGVEQWKDPWQTHKDGWGDCDDLVGWRVAELRAAGERARVQVLRRGSRFHVRVRRANGVVEDPSIKLMPRR